MQCDDDSDYEETLEAIDWAWNKYEVAAQWKHYDDVDRTLTLFQTKAETGNPLLLMTFPMKLCCNYEIRGFSACVNQKYSSRQI